MWVQEQQEAAGGLRRGAWQDLKDHCEMCRIVSEGERAEEGLQAEGELGWAVALEKIGLNS